MVVPAASLAHGQRPGLHDHDRRARMAVPARCAAGIELRFHDRDVGVPSGLHLQAHALVVDPELAGGATRLQLGGRVRWAASPAPRRRRRGRALRSTSRAAVLFLMASSSSGAHGRDPLDAAELLHDGQQVPAHAEIDDLALLHAVDRGARGRPLTTCGGTALEDAQVCAGAGVVGGDQLALGEQLAGGDREIRERGPEGGDRVAGASRRPPDARRCSRRRGSAPRRCMPPTTTRHRPVTCVTSPRVIGRADAKAGAGPAR